MGTTNNVRATVLIKRAEILSLTGAGVLGAGLALLLPKVLESYAVPMVVTGIVMHAWGMYQKHRMENAKGNTRIWWVEAMYWSCWLILAALLLFIAVGSA
jgi:hypothetical protein